MKQVTVFNLGNCLLGIDSTYIHAIHPAMPLIKMPQKEDLLLLGMMKLSDGRFMHVINSPKLLGLSPLSPNESKAIVFQNGNTLMGLIVDSDVRIANIDEETIAGIIKISRVNSEYFFGTATDEKNNVILLLNVEKLLDTLAASSQTC